MAGGVGADTKWSGRRSAKPVAEFEALQEVAGGLLGGW
jgi:hypothetical protein